MVYEYLTLTRPEIVDIVSKGSAIAILPVGSTEQHGPHLPVGTDTYTSEYYVHETLKKVEEKADFLILPHLYYSLSVEHLSYPSTISLSPETLLHILIEIGEGLHKTGIKKLIIFNGHGGNDHILQVAAREIHKLGIKVFCSCVISIIDSMGIDSTAVHADQFETSAIMNIRPELVRKDKITPELDKSAEKWMELSDYHAFIAETWFADEVSVDGVIGKPSESSPEFGKEWLTKIIEEMAKGVEYVIGQ